MANTFVSFKSVHAKSDPDLTFFRIRKKGSDLVDFGSHGLNIPVLLKRKCIGLKLNKQLFLLLVFKFKSVGSLQIELYWFCLLRFEVRSLLVSPFLVTDDWLK